MTAAAKKDIARVDVKVQVAFIPHESDITHDHWVYGYKITLHNTGTVPARLLTRHWIVTDGDERVQEIHGEGVVGRQPYLRPDSKFEYQSHVVIETQVGSMRGSFQMITDDGKQFEAPVPPFTLAPPNSLH